MPSLPSTSPVNHSSTTVTGAVPFASTVTVAWPMEFPVWRTVTDTAPTTTVGFGEGGAVVGGALVGAVTVGVTTGE